MQNQATDTRMDVSVLENICIKDRLDVVSTSRRVVRVVRDFSTPKNYPVGGARTGDLPTDEQALALYERSMGGLIYIAD